MIVPLRLDSRLSWYYCHCVDSSRAKRCLPGQWAWRWGSARENVLTPANEPCVGLLCWPCEVPCLPLGTVPSTVRALSRGAQWQRHCKRKQALWGSG